MEPNLLWILGMVLHDERVLPIRTHAEALQAQGAFKYGGYEFFKKFYGDLAGEKAAAQYKTGLYLAASASAEFIADIALCPLEAVKVRMQTTIPPFATGTFDGLSKITAKEGVAG
jgi:solute carrier family 25 phosphate transporter 3